MLQGAGFSKLRSLKQLQNVNRTEITSKVAATTIIIITIIIISKKPVYYLYKKPPY
jgi:hypothetical protein